MDWWKLFALLIALSCHFSTTHGAKKKIRIHLPQKVKHIHHHKKIYITNHPASSQYAPAYLPTADGSVARPTSVTFPNGLSPLKPGGSGLYDERGPHGTLGLAPTASKLLPLYHARGYYGPTPSDWEEQEYDLVPPPEPTGPGFVPSAFSAPSAPAASASYPPKRVKVIKVKESPRKKKIIRKRKPKRVVHEPPPVEGEHPVSTFHEQFYSDLDGAGTIKKIRKPKRIEKIIDGDTEHIHTYSEEHIHKVVFDDSPKLTGVAGVDPIGSMSGLTAAHPLVPLKNHQSLLALDGEPFSGFGHHEYSKYNPREGSHDHIFHDHGEIPSNMELTKDSLGYPPKVSYTSQGLKLAANKGKPSYFKSKKPIPDFSYYENMYTANGRPKSPLRPSKYFGEPSSETSIDSFRPIPAFPFKDKSKKKTPAFGGTSYYGHNGAQSSSSYQLGQASVPVPFSTSSTVVHNYNPSEGFGGGKPQGAGGYNFKDPFTSFKSVYSQHDAHASSSNDDGSWRNKQGKKSISTQNVSFGGQDHKTVVDHLAAESSHMEPIVKEGSSSHVQQFESFDQSKLLESATPPTSQFTITDNTPAHEYYSAMALKAFQEDPLSVPEASNDNFQYAEAPTPATPSSSMASMMTTPRSFHRAYTTESTTPEPSGFEPDNGKLTKRRRQRKNKASLLSVSLDPRQKFTMSSISEGHEREEEGSSAPRQFSSYRRQHPRPSPSAAASAASHTDDSSVRGNFKYGDKI